MASFRTPKGSYTRNTPDWFQGYQAFASAYQKLATNGPTVVGATQSGGNTVAVPAGTRINDLEMICAVVASLTQKPTYGTWTLLQPLSGVQNNPWWWRYAAAGDPSSFTVPNTLSDSGIFMVTIRGAAIGAANPFDTMAIGEPDTKPMTAPAITGTSANPELLLLNLGASVFSKWSATPGYTALANISDPSLGTSPAMALASTVGTGTIPSSTTACTAPTNNLCGYQQVLIPQGVFPLYASLFNSATDGRVIYVTGLEVDFDAADQLLISINSGPDSVPYTAPFGVFPKNPNSGMPVGTLYQMPGSQLIGYVLQTPSTITHFLRRPTDGDYIAVLPPGYSLAVSSANLGATEMGANFDFFVLPGSA